MSSALAGLRLAVGRALPWARNSSRLRGPLSSLLDRTAPRRPQVFHSQYSTTPPRQSVWAAKVVDGDYVHGSTIHFFHKKLAEPRIVNRHWLRDACPCALCIDPHSGQKTFRTCDLPDKLPIVNMGKTKPEGALEVVWDAPGENHTSLYPYEWIQDHITHVKKEASNVKALSVNLTLWDQRIYARDRVDIDYSDWMAGGERFLQGMALLHSHGLLFLKNMPQTEDAVESAASKIGRLQDTFYGRTWDVRSKPNAENVAYTNAFLGLHQDLLYRAEPPRLQLLHCLENTCEGGESLFSDGMRVNQLLYIDPAYVLQSKSLQERPLLYHYKKNGHWYEHWRPVLQHPWDSMPVAWSPPFQASVQTLDMTMRGDEEYGTWLKATKKFLELLERDVWMHEHKLRPGECVIFDNWRVLHGRRAFDTTGPGSRWLKGTYVSSDEYRSKLEGLAEQLMDRPESKARRIALEALAETAVSENPNSQPRLLHGQTEALMNEHLSTGRL